MQTKHNLELRTVIPQMRHVTESEMRAADIAGIDMEALRLAENPHVHNLGRFTVGENIQVVGFRAHDGMIRDPQTRLLRRYQGGSRLVQGNFLNEAEVYKEGSDGASRLAYGMLNKRAAVAAAFSQVELTEADHQMHLATILDEHAQNGGKTEFVISEDPSRLPFEPKEAIFKEAAVRMYSQGIIGRWGDHQTVIAPDLHTGDGQPNEPNLMNIFASKYRELDTAHSLANGVDPDLYWEGVAAGKVINGNVFRPDATSWGVFLAAQHARELTGALPSDGPQSVKIQGFGNVGLPTAMFMSMDPQQQFNVTAVNAMMGDTVKTLMLKDESQGIHITPEIAEQLKQAPDRIAALAEVLRQHQPDVEFDVVEEHRDNARAIFERPGDWFIPAAGNDVFTDETVPDDLEIINRIARKGFIEGANDAIDDVASERFHKAGKVIIFAKNANPAGTLGSDIEIMDNRRRAENPDLPPMSYEESQREVGRLFMRGLNRLQVVSNKLPEIPPHKMPNVIALTQRAIWHNVPIGNRDLEEIVRAA